MLLLLLQQPALADVSFRSHPEDEQTEDGLVAETPHRPQQGNRNSNDAILDSIWANRDKDIGGTEGRTGYSVWVTMTSYYPNKIVFNWND